MTGAPPVDETAKENARAEVAKGMAALAAARALAAIGLNDDAASRLYYAAFHLIGAALALSGVQAQTHNGLATLLGQHLVRPGLLPASVAKDFALLLGLRAQADYNRHFQLDADGIAEELARAQRLVDTLVEYLLGRGVSATPPA